MSIGDIALGGAMLALIVALIVWDIRDHPDRLRKMRRAGDEMRRQDEEGGAAPGEDR